MAAHEITEWLNAHDPLLAREVATKCYDYVRIILSLSPADVLIKYRPIGRIDGIDQRAAFYGLAGVDYDSRAWILSDMKQRRRGPLPAGRPSRRGKPKKVDTESTSEDSSPVPAQPIALEFSAPMPQRICVFPNPVRNMQVMDPVDMRAVARAWEALTCVVAADDPLWQELQLAIKKLRSEMENGRGAQDAMDIIVCNYPRFLNPLIADHAAIILAKEAYEKQEEIASPPHFEFWIW
jgi:hypothetical protein